MDSNWMSSALQWLGAGADTASSISSVATPALEGAALGAAGGAIGGNPGLGALLGGAGGAALGAFGGGALSGTAQVGGAPSSAAAMTAPASVPFASGDVTQGADTGWYNPSTGIPAATGGAGGTSYDMNLTGPAAGGTSGGATGGAVGGVSSNPTWTDPGAGAAAPTGGQTWTDPKWSAAATGTPAAAGGATPPAGAQNSIYTAFQDPTLANITKAVGGNLGPLVSGGGLAAAALKGNAPFPGQTQLASTAADLAAQGKTLSSYLTSGTLPAGVQASLTQAANAAKASIRSQYAARGMTGSDAEARDLANVDTGVISQGADIATKLLAQGVSESGMSAQLYDTIMKTSMAEDASLGNALTGFAQSLASSGKPITLNVAVP